MIAYHDGQPSPGLVKVQAAEAEILACFLDFCRQHDLTAFLVCGSALGAVRHGGFIPWDDDIDVGMLRGDFERLIALYPRDPIPGHFLQCHELEKAYMVPFAKLRKQGTSTGEKGFAGTAVRSGVFIDIFPFDALPAARFWRGVQYGLLRALSFLIMNFNLANASAPRPALVRLAKFAAYRLRFALPLGLLVRLNRRVSMAPMLSKSGVMASFAMYGVGRSHQTHIVRDCLVPVSSGQFGRHTVPLPGKVEHYLQGLFGDYMQLPPVEERRPRHYQMVDFGDGQPS